ncbi:Uncharacterized protein C45G9.11 [Toxocara canis]|nr:Uncharacterized protein C45G9.11 [Toxocara canis]
MIARMKCALSAIGLRNARVAPISGKVRERHLELEPLCCLSSCLVRGGCVSIVAFEVTYVIMTLFMIALRLHDGGRLKFWSQFQPNLNAVATHQLFLYVVVAFDMLTILMVLAMSRALIRFNKELMRLHWYFDFFSLGFNLFAVFTYTIGLSVPGAQSWSVVNTILVLCFAAQIPIQLWAITVVKSCYDFFVLLHVFIAMAEA